MPFFISDTDITTCKADAIVNAANTELCMGGGVCGAIFRAAGAEEMVKACAALSPIQTGDAVMTPGFALPAKHVIHTAGPIWRGTKDDEAQLYRCYQSALRLAEKNKCKTVVFPLISSGIYGCPPETAERIARKSILDFLGTHDDMTVTLILFGRMRHRKEEPKYESLYEELESFTAKRKAAPQSSPTKICAPRDSAAMICAAADACIKEEKMRMPCAAGGAGEMPPVPESSFSDVLFHFIDEKGFTDPEVYKAANLDRRLFSKFRSMREYTPKKMTVLALAVALRLTVEQTETLLDAAGYSLSRHRQADVIVRWFMERNMYDIYEINDMLLAFHQKQLGQ